MNMKTCEILYGTNLTSGTYLIFDYRHWWLVGLTTLLAHGAAELSHAALHFAISAKTARQTVRTPLCQGAKLQLQTCLLLWQCPTLSHVFLEVPNAVFKSKLTVLCDSTVMVIAAQATKNNTVTCRWSVIWQHLQLEIHNVRWVLARTAGKF